MELSSINGQEYLFEIGQPCPEIATST